MAIFAVMRLKRNIVFCLLAIFMIAKLEPVFPYLKQIPQFTQNLIFSMSAFYNGAEHTDVFAGIEVDGPDADDNKDGEKDAEKEASKTAKEECKVILHDYSLAVIFNANSARTLFHLYASGKERNHVNEVFRPPLV